MSRGCVRLFRLPGMISWIPGLGRIDRILIRTATVILNVRLDGIVLIIVDYSNED
jgi:hypothetical protein